MRRRTGRPLGDVAQFPRVARERVFPEQVERVRGDLRQGLAVLQQNFLRKKWNSSMTSSPSAQRRDRDFQHVEAVEQILPEALGGDELVEVDVGRRDDAHVHGGHPVVADAPDLVLLEHAQELALHVQRDFGYFVEEQRPVVGQFEKPHLAARVVPVNAPST